MTPPKRFLLLSAITDLLQRKLSKAKMESDKLSFCGVCVIVLHGEVAKTRPVQLNWLSDNAFKQVLMHTSL